MRVNCQEILILPSFTLELGLALSFHSSLYLFILEQVKTNDKA